MFTIADRRESVTLSLSDAGFSTGMVKAAAATALVNKELSSLSRRATTSDKKIEALTSRTALLRKEFDGLPTANLVQGMDSVHRSSRDADKSINQLTGRLSLLADAVAILGPGLVPIAAVGVPAISGLAAQMGFAATGAVGFVVAVQGVGEALKAMNAAHLEPTTENLAKARLEMEKLSPAGQDLTRQIYGLRDEWKQLRDVSQGALFHGVSEALDSLETRLPDFERVLANVNRAVGDMLADGAESLASPKWDEFFTFIATDAPPAIANMGEALGNVAGAMARLWMAFDPLNDSFATWLVDSTASLERWADGLAQTQGFEDFVAYVRENGPQVAETMASVATAVLRIVEAAAPLGGPVLQALEGVADAIGTIAGSDAGPAIMSTVTALALLRRGMALFEKGSQVAWVQNVKGAEGFGNKLTAARSPLLKTTAAMTGLAIASSGVADGMLGSNAATGALLGTMGGPWGAAVGGAVGLMVDLTSSVGGFEVNSQALTDTLNQQTGAITQNTTAYAANELEKQGVLKSAQALGLSLSDVTQASLGNEAAMARVTAGLEAAKAGFYDADGRIAVSSETLTTYGERSGMVKDAIGEMSGEVEKGQSRVRRMADATDTAATSLTRAETAAQDFADAVTRLNNVLERRATVRDYEAAVDDLAASIKENGRNFDINTEKGRNNQAALDNVASTAIRLAENLKGAARQRVLTAAIEDLRDAGRKFGVPQSEVKALIKLLREADTSNVNPKIDVDTSGAAARVRAIKAELASIKDEDVYVNVRRVNAGGFGPQATTSADGGSVPKTGKPYADRHLYLLADGEEVISNRHGQADRYRSLLKDINANRRLAEGGTTGKRPRRHVGAAYFTEDNTAALQASLDFLATVAEDQTKALERSTDATKFWADKMSDVAQSTTSGFNTGLFERDSNPWAAGSGGGWLSNLTRDINGLNERSALQSQLAGAGLSGDALAALLAQGSNADLTALVQSGQAQQYAALFNQRAALQGSVGAAGGQLAYGSQYASAQRAEATAAATLAATQQQTAQLASQLSKVQAAVERMTNETPDRTGEAVGRVINDGAAKAQRNKKNGGR